ncbi:MAG: twin-arginine translocase subunit TatC [Deltaproteobacteria bacterium]|jgi:sec-independent protein translocase protein TatC|nr:twin-arginine translocase subunit TatC [Deltaproteobacteria bacterium]
MTGNDPSSPPGGSEQTSSESVAAGPEDRDAQSVQPDPAAFDDALGFPSWDGEDAAREEAPGDGNAYVSDSSEATPHFGGDAEERTEQEGAGKAMSLMEHLSELRSRLVRVLIMVMLGFFACYAVSETLFAELVKPLTASMPPGSKLIFTSIPEAFFVYLKVGFVASLFLTSPYTFYQIWAFVAPGLYAEERRHIVPLAAFSAFFFLAGAAFCYFAVFPMAFAFFMSYATDTILPMPSLDEYLNFALKLLIAFGLIAEMPLFAFFLARIGILTAAHLRRWRKYTVLAGVIVGALLTPPDVPSQLIMAAVILILYEVSILVVALAQKRPPESDEKRKQDAAAKTDAAKNDNKPQEVA